MVKGLLLLIAAFLFGDPPWTPDIQVSQDPGTGNQNETTIQVFDDSLICGGWNDSRTGVYHVGFGHSFDGGITWQETLMIESTYPEDGDPVICVDDSGTIYYFWLSFDRNSYTGDIILTKSNDWGQTWGPMQNVTSNSSSLDDKPWAMVEGSNVFLTWYEWGTSFNLMFMRSIDYGQTWLPKVSVGFGGNGTMPFRGIDSTIYVGWGVQDLMLNTSTNMGQSWQGQQTIIPVVWDPPVTPYRLNNMPSYNTSNDRTQLYVVFADSRLNPNQVDVFFSKSTDGGSSWITPVKIVDVPSGDNTLQFYPWIAVDPYDGIHVTWHDTREGSVYDVAQYYAYSTDYGITWSPNQRLSDVDAYTDEFIGDYTACAADSNYAYALWCDCRNGSTNPDIFFSKAPNAAGVKETYVVNEKESPLKLSFTNPFSSSSKITYWPGDAKLSIYQADGRKIDKLGGTGVYFLILEKDNQTITRKLVKIK